MSGPQVNAHFHQENLLAQLQQSQAPVCIYLLNGVKLQGYIAKFDSHVIVLRSASNSQMVFKHAILTIVPSG